MSGPTRGDRGAAADPDAGAPPGPPAAERPSKSLRLQKGRSGRATRTGLVYGPGALAAAARGDRLFWALHQAALVRGLVPVVPAGVVSEAVRAAGGAVLLEDVLAGTEVEPLDVDRASALGSLAAGAGADNLVTVAVVETAARRNLAAVAERSSKLAEVAAALDHDLVLHVI